MKGSELGEVCVGEVTTWENTKLSIRSSSSILLYKKSSGFTKFALKSPNSTKLEKYEWSIENKLSKSVSKIEDSDEGGL